MKYRIEILDETKLVGKKMRMSFAQDRTIALWSSFSPRKKEIKYSGGTDLYAVDIYNDTKFFVNFNPSREFEKWAAIKVTEFNDIPEGMEKLVIPQGQYAVFHYKGKPSEAQEVFQYIYGKWLPDSIYEMDNRPYFALMGEKYKGEDINSEEEFWIPVKRK